MINNFTENLKKLANIHSQKEIALKTGFSQASVNNYISGSNEPSIAFLIALKEAFGINVDTFLFGEFNIQTKLSCDKFVGHYMVYYYNNKMYKGGVLNNTSNTLNYGVLSLYKNDGDNVKACATFLKSKKDVVNLFRTLNSVKNPTEIVDLHKKCGNFYSGFLNTTIQNAFIHVVNKESGDESFMIFNNPPSPNAYIGGIGTVNSVSRGREYNPCVQYVLISRRLVERSDGEIYDCLQLETPVIDFTTPVKEIIELVKRLYITKDELATNLTESQKEAIVDNNIKYRFNEILDANMFRFAKVSNREDDYIYKIIKEGEYFE